MSAPCHAQHLVEAGLAAEGLAQAVLIERLHAIAECRRLDLAVGGSRLDARAYGVVDHEDFGDAGSAAKAGVAAGGTSDRTVQGRRRGGMGMPRECGLQAIELRAVRRRRRGAVGTEAADKT